MVTAMTTERSLDLVVPLGHKPTAMRRPTTVDFLTRADFFGHTVRTEFDSSKHSGNRARQSCGFFTSGFYGREGDGYNTRKGKKSTDCVRVSASRPPHVAV
jgi:hypothetical protein